MESYLSLCRDIIQNGSDRGDRTGTGVRSVFGRQLRFDLSQGFPLLTTKKLHTRSIVAELLWFLSGSTNVYELQKLGCHIWDPWANAAGELGPVYGKQWRSWQAPDGSTVDQIQNVLDSIRRDPESRRHLVVAWNPGELLQMALAPCHCLFQFFVDKGRLSCQLYQRSCDVFIGMPFNIASYALLTHMLAQQAELDVGEFVWTGGDIHLYSDHLALVDVQLARAPFPPPQLRIKRKPASLFEYQMDDFEWLNYEAHPHIKAPVAV